MGEHVTDRLYPGLELRSLELEQDHQLVSLDVERDQERISPNGRIHTWPADV